MKEKAPNKVVILGAGFIGISLAAVFADAGFEVALVDPDGARLAAAPEGIAAQTKALRLAGLAIEQGGALAYHDTSAPVLGAADLVLECGPEDLAIKQAIFAELLARTPDTAVLATMSSAIPMSQIVPEPEHQTRCLVAHPVNPPAVLRLIELCPAPHTHASTTQRAATLFARAGFEAAILNHEIEGFILNRLQGAVLREAYRLADEGISAPNDIDKVMRLGLGPRWALAGPFETAELNTPGGITAHAARMGPAYKRMGEGRGETVAWSQALVARVAAERDAARGDQTIADRAQWRAVAVARLVALRDQLLRGHQ